MCYASARAFVANQPAVHDAVIGRSAGKRAQHQELVRSSGIAAVALRQPSDPVGGGGHICGTAPRA